MARRRVVIQEPVVHDRDANREEPVSADNIRPKRSNIRLMVGRPYVKPHLVQRRNVDGPMYPQTATIAEYADNSAGNRP